jgi:hypothetical protein
MINTERGKSGSVDQMVFAGKEFMKSKENLSFKGLFKRRSEIAFVAILAVAALHFALQFSFIRSENIENNRAVEIPVKVNEIPDQIEQVQEPAIETHPTKFKTKKSDNAKPRKPVAAIKQNVTETAPSKPLPKKKITVESRTTRLRRAERILTGA